MKKLIFAIASIIGVSFLASTGVSAISGQDFNAGRIIDDYVFYNSKSMNASQIQNFLNSKMPACDTNGTGKAVEWGRPDITRATLASYIRNGTNGYTKDTGFHAPPYTCLRNYKQNTPQMEAASGLCESLSAKSNQSAAQIIKSISDACAINPQVLIVLLEKEQSLVRDVWPLQRQYNSATGFDCPDTAPCDPQYAGFFYQVYYAARQFKIYKKYPDDYNYIAGRTNRIYWHPDLSRCGSSQVYIQNQATAALYIYTPYRPNQAALNNLYGTGDSCSSYGNRNFWRLFTEWFGSTYLSYTKMATPRYMVVREDTRKEIPGMNTSIDDVIPAGTVVYFTSKVKVDGKGYLRSQYDTDRGFGKGIPIDKLDELTLEYRALSEPRWLETNSDIYKIDPQTGEKTGAVVPKGKKIFFPTKTSVKGTTYLRTQHDADNNIQAGILLSDLSETEVTYTPLLTPRWMTVNKTTSLFDLRNMHPSESPLVAGSQYFASHKVHLNGQTYVTSTVPTTGTYPGVPLNNLKELVIEFSAMKSPRTMKVAQDTYKKDIATGANIDTVLTAGQVINFDMKFVVGDKTYLRTSYDTSRGYVKGILLTDLTEI